MTEKCKRAMIVINAGLVTEYYLPDDVELIVVEINPESVHYEPGDEESWVDLDVGPSLITILRGEDVESDELRDMLQTTIDMEDLESDELRAMLRATIDINAKEVEQDD